MFEFIRRAYKKSKAEEWLTKIQTSCLDREDREEFEQWMEDSANREAYQQAKGRDLRLIAILARAAPLVLTDPRFSPELLIARLRKRYERRRRLLWLSVGFIGTLALLVLGLVSHRTHIV